MLIAGEKKTTEKYEVKVSKVAKTKTVEKSENGFEKDK